MWLLGKGTAPTKSLAVCFSYEPCRAEPGTHAEEAITAVEEVSAHRCSDNLNITKEDERKGSTLVDFRTLIMAQ